MAPTEEITAEARIRYLERRLTALEHFSGIMLSALPPAAQRAAHAALAKCADNSPENEITVSFQALRKKLLAT